MTYASGLVQQAVREGLLARPDACERCGKPCKPDGHHADYLKPLLVEWLCKKCHAAADIERRRMGAQRRFGEVELETVTLAYADGRVQVLDRGDLRGFAAEYHSDYTLTLKFELIIVRGDRQLQQSRVSASEPTGVA